MKKISGMKQLLGRTTLQLKKHSPEILIGVGVIGLVGSTVLACKATLKIEGILDEGRDKLDKVNEALNNLEDYEGKYTEQDGKKDKAIVYVQTGVRLAKLYAPAAALGVLSFACIFGSHRVMKRRNVAVVAAYKAVEKSFADYRRRVVNEFGDEKDYEFRHGIIKKEVVDVEIDKKGKKKETKKTVDAFDTNHYSQYARFFDEACANWSKTPEYNMIFLKAQQNYANDLLHSRGHIFLNEVYDMLGLDRSQAGAVVGWVIDKENDNFVDFGLYRADDRKTRHFINGTEANVLLDFNVDGVIYDLI